MGSRGTNINNNNNKWVKDPKFNAPQTLIPSQNNKALQSPQKDAITSMEGIESIENLDEQTISQIIHTPDTSMDITINEKLERPKRSLSESDKREADNLANELKKSKHNSETRANQMSNVGNAGIPGTDSSSQIDNSQQSQTQTSTQAKEIFTEFDADARAPYKIYIQNKDNSQKWIDAIKISRHLIKSFSKEYFDEVKQISKNKLCIIITNKKVANACMKLTYWEENNLSAFIPNHLMVKQGVIRGVPLYINEKEITDPDVAEFSSMYGPIKITHARRFNKRLYNKTTKNIDLIPTTTVQITVKGQILPPEIKINKVVRRVEMYYPQVRQCYRCFQFNHVKANCKSTIEKCASCGQIKHIGDEQCPRKELQPICIHCKQNHLAFEKTCPARLKEQEIRNIATERGSSVAEIKKEIREKRKFNTQEFPTLTQNSYTTLNDLTYSYEENILPSKSYRDVTSNKASQRIPHKMTERSATINHKAKIQERNAKQKKEELENAHKNALIFPNGRTLNTYEGTFSESPDSRQEREQAAQIEAEVEDETSIGAVQQLLDKFSPNSIIAALLTVLNKNNMLNLNNTHNSSLSQLQRVLTNH